MTTGTTADFDVSRDELIDLSLSMLGVSEASSTDRALAVKQLNVLMRSLDAKADFLHTIDNVESTLTTVASQQAYVTGLAVTNISASILRIEYMAVLIGTDRQELTILDKPSSLRTELQDESNGQPVAAHLARAKLLSGNKLYLYPTPNAAYTIKYKFRRPLYDFDLATDNPDIPGYFLLPLQQLLAVALAPHYGTPLQERQLLKQEAEFEFQRAKSAYADRPAYQPLQAEYF